MYEENITPSICAVKFRKGQILNQNRHRRDRFPFAFFSFSFSWRAGEKTIRDSRYRPETFVVKYNWWWRPLIIMVPPIIPRTRVPISFHFHNITAKLIIPTKKKTWCISGLQLSPFRRYYIFFFNLVGAFIAIYRLPPIALTASFHRRRVGDDMAAAAPARSDPSSSIVLINLTKSFISGWSRVFRIR